MEVKVGDIVQFGTEGHWDYTGVVTEVCEGPWAGYIKAEWHKWNNDADNRTLWNMPENQFRVITKRQPGQWWPSVGTKQNPSKQGVWR